MNLFKMQAQAVILVLIPIFIFINLDVYTGFNFDIFGSFPHENEFLISQDFLLI